ncbi:MAG: hypothetical protein WKF73_07600 [Nocardioidaceae bacterium]
MVLLTCLLASVGRRRRAGGPVAGRKLEILDRLLRTCGEQWQEVVVAEGSPGPGAEEAEVGGGGEDGDHDRCLADAHDAEGAAAEGFGVVVLEVAEPALDARPPVEGLDPVGAAPVVALTCFGVDVAGDGDGALAAAGGGGVGVGRGEDGRGGEGEGEGVGLEGAAEFPGAGGALVALLAVAVGPGDAAQRPLLAALDVGGEGVEGGGLDEAVGPVDGVEGRRAWRGSGVCRRRCGRRRGCRGGRTGWRGGPRRGRCPMRGGRVPSRSCRCSRGRRRRRGSGARRRSSGRGCRGRAGWGWCWRGRRRSARPGRGCRSRRRPVGPMRTTAWSS